MRRSFGRMMHRAGTKVTVIQNILGHESLDMTIHYLGLNLDDTASAMEKLVEYQQRIAIKSSQNNEIQIAK